MAGFKDFREIVAWQRAHELKLIADAFLVKPDVMRRFKFCEQLSDSARSAPRNIAEGFARFRHKEFAQFVRVAKGSEAEVLNYFIDARDLRLLSDDEFIHAEHTARRALKAANGLIPVPGIDTRSAATAVQAQTSESTVGTSTVGTNSTKAPAPRHQPLV